MSLDYVQGAFEVHHCHEYDTRPQSPEDTMTEPTPALDLGQVMPRVGEDGWQSISGRSLRIIAVEGGLRVGRT